MKITLYIENNYVRAQFLAGIELQQKYEIELDISTLSREERQFIIDSWPKDEEGIIITVHAMLLKIPCYDSDKNKIVKGSWFAEMNPEKSEPCDIIKSWMQVYATSLEEAKVQDNKYRNQSQQQAAG